VADCLQRSELFALCAVRRAAGARSVASKRERTCWFGDLQGIDNGAIADTGSATRNQ
jgi:hypothetical protein